MAQAKATPQDLSKKLNTLESAIVNAEDSADDGRYQQAEIVARMLKGDGTQKQTTRQVAAKWINGRTGKPYTHTHVRFVDEVWARFGKLTFQDRPDWTTAYYTVQQKSDEIVAPEQRRQEWTQAHEARAPKSEEAAERLVQNILKESPGVVDTVYQGLREGREDRYIEPQQRERQRKEAESWARDVGEPIMDKMSELAFLLSLENALEELQEMSAIDGAAHDRGIRLVDAIRHEMEVKRAMEGVR